MPRTLYPTRNGAAGLGRTRPPREVPNPPEEPSPASPQLLTCTSRRLPSQGKKKSTKEFVFYKVLWDTFPPEAATLEPESSIHDDLIDEYEAAMEAEAELEAEAPVAAAPDLSPLAASTCVGRRVLVPHSTYPSYVCDEQGGRGWSAIILSCTRAGVATLRYTDAATARGVPYEDVSLQLAALTPL